MARKYDVHPALTMKWQKTYYENPDEAFKGNGNTYKLEARNAQLERLVGQLYAENDFFKKGYHKLREAERGEGETGKKEAGFMSIKEMRSGPANISVHRASHLLGIQRSEYYRWPITCLRRSEKALKDEALQKEITSIIEEMPGYGYRRVTVELQDRGNEVNHKKIMEVMNKNGLQRKEK